MTTEKIEMTFACDQDWDDMKVSCAGRYCELCNKNVYDFTHKSKAEIDKIADGNEVCAMFLIEQTESNLIPIEVPSQSLFVKFVLTLGAITWLQINTVNAQDLSKKDSIVLINQQHENDEISIPPQGEKNDSKQLITTTDCEQVKRQVKKKYYLTSRFPFIAKRRIRIMGRYRR